MQVRSSSATTTAAFLAASIYFLTALALADVEWKRPSKFPAHVCGLGGRIARAKDPAKKPE
jgi:hypothetical protein